MWQRGHQIGWQFRWVTKKSDSIVTKNCDKFGDSTNMSPTLSPDWSQNTVNHQIGHQICHKICHQTPWGSYMCSSGQLTTVFVCRRLWSLSMRNRFQHTRRPPWTSIITFFLWTSIMTICPFSTPNSIFFGKKWPSSIHEAIVGKRLKLQNSELWGYKGVSIVLAKVGNANSLPLQNDIRLFI